MCTSFAACMHWTYAVADASVSATLQKVQTLNGHTKGASIVERCGAFLLVPQVTQREEREREREREVSALCMPVYVCTTHSIRCIDVSA